MDELQQAMQLIGMWHKAHRLPIPKVLLVYPDIHTQLSADVILARESVGGPFVYGPPTDVEGYQQWAGVRVKMVTQMDRY